MERNRHNECSLEFVTFETLLQDSAQWSGQGDSVGVLQVVDDFTERVCEEQGRSSEIEQMLALKAETAKALDCGRGFAAF
jgi:hypothetical protein